MGSNARAITPFFIAIGSRLVASSILLSVLSPTLRTSVHVVPERRKSQALVIVSVVVTAFIGKRIKTECHRLVSIERDVAPESVGSGWRRESLTTLR